MDAEMVDRFFAYARARQDIKLKRDAGLPAPWTDDPILREFRFCNVYREDDRVTRWFRENIRDPLRHDSSVLYATVLFRWFNRITTGERLLAAGGLELFRAHNPEVIRSSLTGISPITTAAYIIKTPNGMKKLEGLLWCLEKFWQSDERQLIEGFCEQGGDLEGVHRWLMQCPFLGGFMAYEIVTDLRHTDLLADAPDVCTWANAGPGAMRGLNLIHNRPVEKTISQKQACAEMKQLLDIAPKHGWLDWEMREVEHTLCEFLKIERARGGWGRCKQLYRPT